DHLVTAAHQPRHQVRADMPGGPDDNDPTHPAIPSRNPVTPSSQSTDRRPPPRAPPATRPAPARYLPAQGTSSHPPQRRPSPAPAPPVTRPSAARHPPQRRPPPAPAPPATRIPAPSQPSPQRPHPARRVAGLSLISLFESRIYSG